jgi:hypothetical protein
MWMKTKIFRRKFETMIRCNKFKKLKKLLAMERGVPKWD